MLHAAPITMMPPLLGVASVAAAGVVLVLASLHDIASRTLPNWASLTLACIGIALRGAGATLLLSLGLALLVFLVFFLCWRRGWLGGGDVKLLAACSLLVPPGQVLDLILATAMAGGVLAAIYLLLRRVAPGPTPPQDAAQGRRSPLLRRVWRIECWRIRRRGSLPYGCAIATAALIMLLIPESSGIG